MRTRNCEQHALPGNRVGCLRCDSSWDAGEDHRCQYATKVAPDLLLSAEATFRQRNAIYGNNYQRAGALLLALFPEDGIPAVTTPDAALRLSLMVDCAKKLQRYAHNFTRGGHQDSAHDLIVYAAMLEEATNES